MKNKILLLMVEGQSEEVALEFLFDEIYNENVKVNVLHCDITNQNAQEGIYKSIQEKVEKYLSSMSLYREDIKGIIQIIDLDGAYANNSCIIEIPNLEKTIYSPDKIETKDKEQLVKRNERKRKNINDMILFTQIEGIPYSVYYMSCNLDHVLYDKQNNVDSKKRKAANKIMNQYQNDIECYKKFLCSSDFSVILGYKESWEFIKKDNNSLKRYTNIGIALNPKE